MTITLPKSIEEKLSRLPREQRVAFVSRAIEGELKMEHIFGDEVAESDAVIEARAMAHSLRSRSKEENFGELAGLLNDFEA